ncbi:MAG TPA: NAD(P)-dependent oxidoreductase [Opitutus sp.]|nr:NAD(P)-dependent oxidoreductase [Opitutus sp.]
MNTVGIIGLGIIGEVWARNYAAAGKLAGAWNRTPKPDVPGWKDSAAAVAEAADVIQIVVADPAAVQGVLSQIQPKLRAGKVVVQSSTIDAASSARFEASVAESGASYVAAPFTGSKPAAEQKQTVFYLGGDRALIAQLEPLLALISAKRFVIGTNEQACTLKLAMNLNIAAQMQALAEALTMARASEISDDVFFNALSQNVSYSGLTKLKEPKLRAADFAPQFSVKHMHKDLRLASAMAGCTDFPVLDAVREALKTAEARGMGDEDFSALIKLLTAG